MQGEPNDFQLIKEQTMFKDHGHSGRLIAICGVDGAGKSTLVKGISSELSKLGFEVVITHQPTNSLRANPLFKSYLYNPEKRESINYNGLLALMISDRLQHITEVIVPALKSGKVVISDRYIFTLLANMKARGYNEPWVYEICKHILKPDATFVLVASIDRIINRILERETFEDSYVERDLLIKSQNEYLWCAKEYDLHTIKTDDLGIDESVNFAMREINAILN